MIIMVCYAVVLIIRITGLVRFHLPLFAWSVPEIFAIKVLSCPNSSTLLITHEPLHSAWWIFLRTCISTTFRTLLNFKVIGQRSRSRKFYGVFFGVRDAAATRGQYLALIKAWWSRCWFVFPGSKIRSADNDTCSACYGTCIYLAIFFSSFPMLHFYAQQQVLLSEYQLS